MRVSQVRLFRRALVALILVVIVAVGLNYVQTWRRCARVVQQAAKILSTEMLRSADSIEYSEHENGIMHFKLRAEKLLETRQGINLLEGIDAYDYNPDGSTKNHIRSRKAEYDREHRKAYFLGDVQIHAGTGVELRTNSLHYDLENNTGKTDDPLSISSPQARGSAKGASYDHSQGVLELQSQLDFVVQHHVRNRAGVDQVEKMRVRASRGYYSETAHIIKLQGNTSIESDSASLSGNEIEVAFSPDKKRLTSLYCNGNAVYLSKDADEVRTLRGERMVFGINPNSRALEKIDVFRNAIFSTKSSESEQLLSGSELHVGLDPVRGILTGVNASGGVTFRIKRGLDQTAVEGEQLAATFEAGSNLLQKMRVWGGAKMSSQSRRDADGERLSAQEIRMSFGNNNGRSILKSLEADQSVSWISAPRKAAEGKPAQSGRSLSASFLEMIYSSSGEYLESGHATGQVTLSGVPLGDSSQAEIRRLKADTVRFQFYPRDNQLQSFDADDHVDVLYHKPPLPPDQGSAQESRTSSSKMRATFREADGKADSVRQSGDFVYQDGSRTATSATSDYDAAKEILLLRGSPRIVDQNSTTTGELVRYDQGQKILSVSGSVRSVLSPRDAGQATPFSSSSEASSPSVVTAEMMEYWTETSRVRYSGKVQMLSENSQMSARTLELRDAGVQVDADGDVRHLLPRTEGERQQQRAGSLKTPAGPARAKSGSKASPILVQSAHLKYLKEQNSIHYTGNVILQSDDIWMSSDSLDAMFSSEGKVEQAAARGKLQVRQAGREVKGQNGDYDLNLGKFVVTGNPAEIKDPEKGRSVAPRLTFFTSDDRILLGP